MLKFPGLYTLSYFHTPIILPKGTSKISFSVSDCCDMHGCFATLLLLTLAYQQAKPV